MARTGQDNVPDSTKDVDAGDVLDDVGTALDKGEIPIQIHNNGSIHQRELESIFGRNWVFVGHESEIEAPGDYAQRYIGEDPFILTRDEDGGISVLFNSCRHRGSKVCRSEYGNTTHFRCPYHGWTYDNQGKLIGRPNNDAYCDDDGDDISLNEAPRVESYRGLVFASIDPDVPDLEEYLGNTAWYLDVMFGTPAWEVYGKPLRWESNVNWKLGADNFAGDNAHITITHKSLNDADIGSSTVAGNYNKLYAVTSERAGLSFFVAGDEDESIFWGHPPEVVELFDDDAVSADQFELAQRSATSLGTIFPNLTFYKAYSTDSPRHDPITIFFLRQWQPKGPHKSEMWHWTLVPADASEEYKERVAQVVTAMFSSSGSTEQDDIAVWDGITDAAGSVFAEKHDVSTMYNMGSDGGQGAAIASEWMGPGTAYEPGEKTDANQSIFYENWYEMMQTDL